MPPSLRHNLDQVTCAVAWTTHAQASAVLWLRSSLILGDLAGFRTGNAFWALFSDHGNPKSIEWTICFGKGDAGKLALGIPKSNFWASDPNGINQVGCVYTAQGFEFDYVGVLLGRDLVYDAGWRGNRKVSHDSLVKKAPEEEFVNLVKQTYRVLLIRGMKGCYVYFEDAATKEFFLGRMSAVIEA